MNETGALSGTNAVSGIAMEELSATEAWRSLGPNIRRLLTLALESRNLRAALHETHPTLDDEMQQLVMGKLLLDPAIQSVVNLYALGIPASKTPLNAITTSTPPVASVPPVIECGVLSDAEEVG